MSSLETAKVAGTPIGTAPLAFWVPFVKGWERARKRGRKQFFDSGAQKNVKAQIAWAARAAMGEAGVAGPIGGPVALHVLVAVEVPQSWAKARQAAALGGAIVPETTPDLDNVAKLIGDALNGVVWADDRQIADATLRRRYGPSAAMRVEVRRIDGGEA